MPRLLLMRHAKSSWKNPPIDDFDRSLNGRGRKAAELMGRALAARHLLPGKILSSSSRRTRDTLTELLPFLESDTDVRLTRDLYLTSEDRYIDVIRAHGNGTRTLMVLGHNPAMEELTHALCGDGSAKEPLANGFPTGALAIIDFEVSRWTEMEPGDGKLIAFLTPEEVKGGK
jgi:phosphohistidine phosphatase